ncbi:CHAP domain-containing protein [Nonomuraea helvata]|uniref:CHAP domain-containing protein n=1 Tax=Nonomuraea helvata TaxID=37484 RepID=A0ABV5S442_9ACTN
MVKNIFTGAPQTGNLSRFALCMSVAVGAGLAGTPTFAVHHRPDTRTSQWGTLQKSPGQVTAQEVIRIAESQIGVAENAAGGGTPFQSWYMSSPRAAETVARDGGTPQSYANAPWCAMFVAWVGEKAGARPTVGWDAYTVTWAKWFEANRRWGAVPRPGAVVFFAWQTKSISGIEHMGLVKQDNRNGTITTIEGNTDDGRVEVRIRPTSQVVGYGYPQYKP